MNKSRKKIEQDYARNAIVDGNTSAGRYEAKKALELDAGQPKMNGMPHMYGRPKMQGSPGKFVGALIGGLASKAVGSLASAAVSSLGSKQPEMKGQPHMESNKQEKYNLMNDNPLAKHASNSWLSKHMK